MSCNSETFPLTCLLLSGRGPTVGQDRWQQEVLPLNALTGEHEEEDGGNHQSDTQLPLQQHGWTDAEWAESGWRRWGCEVSINQWACYVSIFGPCHLSEVFFCSDMSPPLGSSSMKPEFVSSFPVDYAALWLVEDLTPASDGKVTSVSSNKNSKADNLFCFIKTLDFVVWFTELQADKDSQQSISMKKKSGNRGSPKNCSTISDHLRLIPKLSQLSKNPK